MTERTANEVGTTDQSARLLAFLGLQLPRSAHAHLPRDIGVDWAAVAADPRQSIVFVSRPQEAQRLCAKGQPAIAVTGISKGKLAKWLRQRGAVARDKSGAH